MDAGTEAQPLLPVRSQPLLALAVAVALAALAVWYVAAGGLHGGLVHHDAPPPAGPGSTVNVNTAAAAELAQLPGLGPTTAARIVEHRRAHGPFENVEALLDVPGVGPATLERIRPHVRPIRAAAPADAAGRDGAAEGR